MAAGTYNIDVEQGADLIRTFTCTDDEPTVFTDVEAACLQVRRLVRKAFEEDPIAEWDLGEEIAIDAIEQVLELEVAATATAELPAGTYAYDLFLRYGDGTTVRLLEGQVIVAQCVTRCESTGA